MRFQKFSPVIAIVFILALLMSACNAIDLGSVSASGAKLAAAGNAELSQDLQLGQTRFFGNVAAIDADRIKVDDVVFRVDSNSNLPKSLQVGDAVAVNALLLPDQSRYVVSLITSNEKVANDDAATLEFKLYGQVDGMGSESWIVSDEIIMTSAGTMIDPSVTLSSLVEVEGVLANGVLMAKSIELEDGLPGYPVGTVTVNPSVTGTPAASATPVIVSGNEVEFYGNLEANSGSNWVIGGKTVAVVPQTEIKGNLVVGDFVKVEAWVQQDGALIAREIEKEDKSEYESENEMEDHDSDDNKVKGTISAISTNSITVAGVVIMIDSFTKIEGSLLLGAYVEVEGSLQSDGSLLAKEISLEDDDDMDDDSNDDLDDDSEDDYDDDSDDDYDDDHDDDYDDDSDDDYDDDHDDDSDDDSDDD